MFSNLFKDRTHGHLYSPLFLRGIPFAKCDCFPSDPVFSVFYLQIALWQFLSANKRLAELKVKY